MPEFVTSYEGETRRDLTATQRAVVVEEMNRILGHPIFKSSNRCVALLRYVVDRALAGKERELKERTLGVEVFGREANYDVSTDPIVRRVANEIRKRLAQYYQEAGADHNVQIQLLRGSYLPAFQFEAIGPNQTIERAEIADEPERDLGLIRPVIAQASGSVPRHFWRWLIALIATASIAVICILLARPDAFRSPNYKIWKPLLDSGGTITVALPIRAQPGGNATNGEPLTDQPSTLFRDVRVGSTIATLLSNFKRQPDLRPSSAIKFRDLHQNPAVLIGGTNNPWVPVLLAGLRYSVQYDSGTGDKWIQDSQNVSNREWKIDGKLKLTDDHADYAVVSRFFDPESRQWILALSGLESYSTEAAGELVADPTYAKLIPASIGEKGNFQIIIKTEVIGAEPGPIQIMAVYTW